MRNLTLHRIDRRNVEFMKNMRFDHQSLKTVQCAINSNSNNMYVLLDNYLYSEPVTIKSHIKNDRHHIVVNLDQYCFSKVISIEYCIALQELFCAYKSGCIARIDITDENRIDYDIVKTFNSGLQCMKFSPDHELIAAVTGAGIVITMVLDFQVMSEANLYSQDFGQNQFVTVGWGKKETQFHGSIGKAAAQAKPEQLIPNEQDNGDIRIAWREDGAFFAVNFLYREIKIRKFKIFNREGNLCYTSEYVNGLGECIAWSPLKNMIAVTQTYDDKYLITFFEKNGLKYSDFLLPFKPQEAKVKDLLWSPYSNILAIICHQSETSKIVSSIESVIQLWIENNSHWYLKQTLLFSVENPLLYATWSNIVDQTNQEELIYLTTKELTFCSFNWCVNHSRGETMNDKVVIGVIDGNRILVTDFRDAIIPPPMSHKCLETCESQNAIIFAPKTNKSSQIYTNEFCTVSCNNRLTFFKQLKGSSSIYKISNLYSINFDILYDIEHGVKEHDGLKMKELKNYYLHHFLWFTERTMLFSTVTNNHLLCVLSLEEANFNGDLTVQEIHVLDYPIEHIISSPDASTAYIKVKERIFKYTKDKKLEQTNVTLNKLCIQMEVIKIDSKDIILALSLDNSFLIDGKEIAKNITSFYVHSDFLLLTTLQHTLICVQLNEIGLKQLNRHDLTIKPWLENMKEMSLTGIYIRRVEKDSHIIAAIPQDSKIILQMPRGNLECIQPKALLLHILKYYFNSCDYLAALDIMTKQRINLNLIYDYNPQLFLDNVDKFVEDIVQHKQLNWLNLFLTELQNEDVVSTMFANCYVDRPEQSNTKSTKTAVNKVDEICKLLRDAMEKRPDADDLIQPILISLVKNQQRQGLENALNRIKLMKTLHCSTYEALKYLLHFVNIDVLYDVALGMYDLELAMFIASKSSKDPKEYIPFLNNLKKLDQNYMKYSINMHLKRYESALEYLSKDSIRFDECLDLICNQKLYKTAMKLFEKNTTEHKMVARAYGRFLSGEKKFSEAGMMFYRSGDLDEALKTFSMSSDNWEDVIAISKEMKLSPIDLHELYKVLVERLKIERKYEHAAVILKEYLNDIEEAVALLCEGRIWKHAIRIAFDVQRLDLNETHIKPGVKEHAEHVILQLNKIKEDFLRYKLRLAIVRTEIEAKQTQTQLLHEKIYNDEQEFNKEVLDSISDTTSIADSTSSRMSRLSITSGKSYRSSKNRRKQERKFLSLKEGSIFEDLSLIYALYEIIRNAYKDRGEWFQLVEILIRFELDESAEKISVEAREFFQLVEKSKSEIWSKSAPTSLTDIENMPEYTQVQLREMIAPIKVIERCMMYPPEADATSYVLTIF